MHRPISVEPSTSRRGIRCSDWESDGYWVFRHPEIELCRACVIGCVVKEEADDRSSKFVARHAEVRSRHASPVLVHDHDSPDVRHCKCSWRNVGCAQIGSSPPQTAAPQPQNRSLHGRQIRREGHAVRHAGAAPDQLVKRTISNQGIHRAGRRSITRCPAAGGAKEGE